MKHGLALFEFLIAILLTVVLFIFVQPTFERYWKLRDQATAKHNLRRLHKQQEAFYAKYGTYTSNLVALGWRPIGRLRYHYGFPAALVPKEPPEGYAGDYRYAIMNTENVLFMEFFAGAPKAGGTIPSLHGNVFGHGVLEQDGKGIAYVAAAIANLDDDDALDRIVITDEGRIIHLCDDIRIVYDDDPACQRTIYNYGR